MVHKVLLLVFILKRRQPQPVGKENSSPLNSRRRTRFVLESSKYSVNPLYPALNGYFFGFQSLLIAKGKPLLRQGTDGNSNEIKFNYLTLFRYFSKSPSVDITNVVLSSRIFVKLSMVLVNR